MIFTDPVNEENDTDELFKLSGRYDMLTLHAQLFIVTVMLYVRVMPYF
jgi:hypothetical protein